ncbi:MAG: Membrane domain of glycerophosphoryl diester phosphodiesterase [Acetobacterium sp.]|nr:Membrane domain of glycerophosphoryl diester phosphodiesterase [Acetobacterium sp.]
MGKKESSIFSRTKEILTLIQFNLLHLLFFEAIYTVAGTMIIYPGGFFLFNKAITLLGFPYLSGSNFTQALTNPLFLLTFICFALLVAFLVCWNSPH